MSNCLLKGANYKEWLLALRVELASARLASHIGDSVPLKSPMEAERAWGLRFKSLHPHLHQTFQDAITAKEIVQLAQSLFGSQDAVRYHQTLQAASQLKYDGDNLESHLANVQRSINQLNTYAATALDEPSKVQLLQDTFPRTSPWLEVKARCIAGEIRDLPTRTKLLSALDLAREKLSSPALLLGNHQVSGNVPEFCLQIFMTSWQSFNGNFERFNSFSVFT
jgi:hypothetical protein